MKVISLVPSLSETLAECGVNLVGRTRYCIHPASRMQHLPVVGGTKDLSWEKVKALAPDLLIVDREENLPWMKEQAPCTVHVFHATALEAMPSELEKLAQLFGQRDPDIFRNLLDLSRRYQAICDSPQGDWDFSSIPGRLDINISAATTATSTGTKHNIKSLRYVIWKRPWMRVEPETYIGSVLIKLGATPWFQSAEGTSKYPEFDLDKEDHSQHFYLFSSEPFPFGKDIEALKAQGLQCALVDGECYSWFGLRSLRFLEAQVGYRAGRAKGSPV